MVLNQLFWLNFATRSNCPGKEMSVCSNFSLKLSFYWVRHISLTSLTIVVRKNYTDQSTTMIHFFSGSNCPGRGLSICSNFYFEWGFLVSQAHLPELASSCSKKELSSSIHNEDRLFNLKHIFVNSFPVVVRNNYINQSITMIDFSLLK